MPRSVPLRGHAHAAVRAILPMSAPRPCRYPAYAIDLAGGAPDRYRGAGSGARISAMNYEITPEQACRGQLLPDRELVMLGAHWLAAGYDSPALLQLASLGPPDLSEAR